MAENKYPHIFVGNMVVLAKQPAIKTKITAVREDPSKPSGLSVCTGGTESSCPTCGVDQPPHLWLTHDQDAGEFLPLPSSE